jgi:hypothetical protein
MGKDGQDAGPHLTSQRAGRLYRLLLLLRSGPCHRDVFLRNLGVDLRGFYRDLELLRSLGVAVGVEGKRYRLIDPLGDALARLPFPDAGLSVQDALVLSKGTTDAHRRFRRRLETYLGPAKKSAADRRSPAREPSDW